MIRAQIQLTKEQHQKLRQRAQQLGLSVAGLIREWVDSGLSREGAVDPWDRLLSGSGSVVGKGVAKDLGRNHDRYLNDAFSR